MTNKVFTILLLLLATYSAQCAEEGANDPPLPSPPPSPPPSPRPPVVIPVNQPYCTDRCFERFENALDLCPYIWFGTTVVTGMGIIGAASYLLACHSS